MSVTDLHVHAGAHTTATALIQRALDTDRERLSGAGLAILTRADIEPFLVGMLGRGRTEQRLHGMARAWTELAGTVEGHERILVSYEDLLGSMRSFSDQGRLYPRAELALASLVDGFRPDQLTVHMYTRRQDTFLEAVYLQSIYAGGAITFEDWIEDLRCIELRWTEVLERVEQVTHRLTVRYFEEINDGPEKFVRRFFDDVGSPVEPSSSALRSGRGSDDLSEVGMRILLVANPALDRADRLSLRRYVKRELSGKQLRRPVLFQPDARERLLLELAADNRELHERYVHSDAASSPYLASAL